jgi:thiol:disulfide interchange protein DsbA
MQVDKRRIMSEDDLVNFAGEIGIDKQKFREAYDSFYVETRVRKAEEMQKRYGIDGVPAVIVNGKYRTSPSMTGSIDKFLQVMSFLVDKELKAQAPAASPTPAAEPQPKPAS